MRGKPRRERERERLTVRRRGLVASSEGGGVVLDQKVFVKGNGKGN